MLDKEIPMHVILAAVFAPEDTHIFSRISSKNTFKAKAFSIFHKVFAGHSNSAEILGCLERGDISLVQYVLVHVTPDTYPT